MWYFLGYKRQTEIESVFEFKRCPKHLTLSLSDFKKGSIPWMLPLKAAGLCWFSDAAEDESAKVMLKIRDPCPPAGTVKGRNILIWVIKYNPD